MYKIPARTLFLGKNLVFMPECHSTNTFASDLCQQSPLPPEGTVVITANQTAGRGQRGNTWFVEPGKNLTFSIILYPTFLALSHQFNLNIICSLAITDYLLSRGCRNVKIKWPNDIYVNDLKICGILIESQIMGKLISSSIVGIGLNINQQLFDMDTATSLALQTNGDLELSDELDLLLSHIEARFLQLKQGHYEQLRSAYLSKLYWLNEAHTFDSPSIGRFSGMITGIDPSGQLIVKVDGTELQFGMKGVSYVRT